MSTRVLTLVLAAEGLVIAAQLLVAVDLYAHRRLEQVGGWNIRGYRGPVMAERRPDEVRLAVVGGTLAFGWGVAAGETLAPSIRQRVSAALDRPGGPAVVVTAVNLGQAGLPAAHLSDRLRRHAALAPDVVCIYPDPVGQSSRVVRQLPPVNSGIRRLTGYSPILPLVLEEKGEQVGGVVGAMSRTAAVVLGGFDRALAALSPAAPAADALALEGVLDAVALALRDSRGVVVAIPAPPPAMGKSGLEGLADALTARFPGEARLRVVDLGTEPRLGTADLRVDDLNYGAAGHALAADRLVPAVLDLLGAS